CARLCLRMAGVRHSHPEPVAAAVLPQSGGRMSDYLLNLAVRTLRPAGTIQPRRASRFEPPVVARGPEPVSDPAEVDEEHDEVSVAKQIPEVSRTAQTPAEPGLRAPAHHPGLTENRVPSSLRMGEGQGKEVTLVGQTAGVKLPPSPPHVPASQPSV